MNKIELEKIKKKALENHIPIIMDDTLEVIEKELREIKPKRILEIGTAVGYSAICFSEFLNEGGIIDTIEREADRVQEAKKNIERAEVQDRINIIEGDAVEILPTLQEKYDAVFLAIGANVPEKMDIEGENLSGVYGANALLEKNLHPNYIGKNIAVIGGGNVAMDAARTVKKMGAKNVYVIYRRSEEQMPAEKKEVELAKKEGIEFIFKSNIRKILGKDKVQEIECIKTKLVKRENDKRLYPIDIVGSNYKLKVDYVIMAIGSKPDSKIIKDFKTDKYGYIEVNAKMQTSIPTVYAGGDITGETATVAWAAKDGRTVAENIIKEL